MICAPDPCECFTPKKKVVTPRKRPVEEPVQQASPLELPDSQAPRQDLRARMKAAAAAAPAVQIERVQPKPTRRTAETELVKTAPAPRPTLSDDQVLLNAALRALGPILHSQEQDRYRMLLGSTPTQAERKAEWKARRRWQQVESSTGSPTDASE